MSNQDINDNPALKQRISDEIANQVEEFLRKGGSIEVVENQAAAVALPKGSIWDDNTSGLLG